MSLNNMLIFCLISAFLFTGCGGTADDLLPSGADKRPPVEEGTTGADVNQYAPDFSLSDTLGNTFTLSTAVSQYRGVVMYFTMWCPTCDSHMSYMRDNMITQNPDVLFLAVDYVSGSVSAAADAERSNGYAGSGFVVLADTGQGVLDLYNATMATAVVIDRNGIVQMNEEFKTDRLQSTLDGLQ